MDFYFDATEVDTSDQQEIPAGEYLTAVKKIEHGMNKNQTGELVKAVIEILEGQHKGRVLFENFNTKHENKQAEAIGKKRFAALCLALDRPRIRNVAELMGIPFIAKVGARKDGTMEIKTFSPRRQKPKTDSPLLWAGRETKKEEDSEDKIPF